MAVLATMLIGLLAVVSSSSADSMVVQPDGKIVIGGAAPGGFGMLARLEPNGSLDATFGQNGIAIDYESPSFTEIGRQPDGRIVALNTGRQLRRYDLSGRLDQSFGEDSSVAVGGSPGGATPLSMLPDGRIAIGGTFDVKQMRSLAQAWVVSTDGRSVEEVGQLQSWSWLTALAAREDGSLIMAGFAGSLSGTGPPTALARFMPGTGTPYDPAFGGGTGVATLSRPDWRPTFEGLALTPGAIFGAGAVREQLTLARFSADGLIDTSFGDDGFASGPPPSSAYDVAVAPDGKPLVAARLGIGSDCREAKASGFCPRPALLRFLPNGLLDPAFGQGGISKITGPDGQLVKGVGETVVPLADGGALLAGGTTSYGRFVARVKPDGQLDTAFGQGGLAVVEACPGSFAERRKSGCLPSAQVRITLKRGRRGHVALRLHVRPDREWGRIGGVALDLPRQLKPIRDQFQTIRARLNMRPNSPRTRTTRVSLRGRRISAYWSYQPSGVSIPIPAKALKLVKPLSIQRALRLRLKVQLGTAFERLPGNQQRIVLQRAVR